MVNHCPAGRVPAALMDTTQRVEKKELQASHAAMRAVITRRTGQDSSV